jgi:polycomb protein EED
VGKTYVWDVSVADPDLCRFNVLSHPKCTSAIRQTGVSRNGDTIICVCDDGSVWRWDRQQHK